MLCLFQQSIIKVRFKQQVLSNLQCQFSFQILCYVVLGPLSVCAPRVLVWELGGGLYHCLILIALAMFFCACFMHTQLGDESGTCVSSYTELRELLLRFYFEESTPPPNCREPLFQALLVRKLVNLQCQSPSLSHSSTQPWQS